MYGGHTYGCSHQQQNCGNCNQNCADCCCACVDWAAYNKPEKLRPASITIYNDPKPKKGNNMKFDYKGRKIADRSCSPEQKPKKATRKSKKNGKSKNECEPAEENAEPPMALNGQDCDEPQVVEQREQSLCDDRCPLNTGQMMENDPISNSTIEACLNAVQKCLEQALASYFMHSMEKIECLSAQLLRNECLLSKMHLDIGERFSRLSERTLAQFQVLCERQRQLQNCCKTNSFEENCYNSDDSRDDFDDDDECVGLADDVCPIAPNGNQNNNCSNTVENDCCVDDCRPRADSLPPQRSNSRRGSVASCIEDDNNEDKQVRDCEQRMRKLQEALDSVKCELKENIERLSQTKETNWSRGSTRRARSPDRCSISSTQQRCGLEENASPKQSKARSSEQQQHRRSTDQRIQPLKQQQQQQQRSSLGSRKKGVSDGC